MRLLPLRSCGLPNARVNRLVASGLRERLGAQGALQPHHRTYAVCEHSPYGAWHRMTVF